MTSTGLKVNVQKRLLKDKPVDIDLVTSDIFETTVGHVAPKWTCVGDMLHVMTSMTIGETFIKKWGCPIFNKPKHWRHPHNNRWICAGFESYFRPSEEYLIALFIRKDKSKRPVFEFIAYNNAEVAENARWITQVCDTGIQDVQKAYLDFLGQIETIFTFSTVKCDKRSYAIPFGLDTLLMENYILNCEKKVTGVLKRRRIEERERHLF